MRAHARARMGSGVVCSHVQYTLQQSSSRCVKVIDSLEKPVHDEVKDMAAHRAPMLRKFVGFIVEHAPAFAPEQCASNE